MQISTDGGATWERVEMAYPGTSTSSSDACGLPTGQFFTGHRSRLDDATPRTSRAWADQLVDPAFPDLAPTAPRPGSGWWIDDITITEVDVPGVCATGSSCADNPFVNVQPDGPLTVCEYDSPTLIAEVSSGNPPFAYQWYMDGEVIPGATGSTFTPTEPGTHRYNVKVKADACDDDVIRRPGHPGHAGEHALLRRSDRGDRPADRRPARRRSSGTRAAPSATAHCSTRSIATPRRR